MFICTGNICRSPTAERLATTVACNNGIPDLTASSAGTRAVIGHPIHRQAAIVLERLGGDPSDFAARQLTSKIASASDLIITMTRQHRDIVLEAAPRQLRRTFTLAEAAHLSTMADAETIADLAELRPYLGANKAWDVPDPIGQGADVFTTVGSQIADLLTPVLELCRRSNRN